MDPTRISAQVTREVAALLAQLAKSLEGSYSAKVVASYLTRSLFSMFAEDVELLPKDAYKSILKNCTSEQAVCNLFTEPGPYQAVAMA